MKKEKRKKRNTMAKDNKKALLKPLDITQFGTENDPCFGKLYNPQNSICARCGDSEFCAVMMGQNNHIKRTKVEKKTKFKDIEEEVNDKPLTKDELKAAIKENILYTIKSTKEKGITEELLINTVYSLFATHGASKTKIARILEKQSDKTTKYTKKKNLYLWKL